MTSRVAFFTSRVAFFAVVLVASTAGAFANDTVDSAIYHTMANAQMDSGWVVGFPTGSSDYFNTAHGVVAGIGNSESMADGLPVTSMAVSVADFGSGRTYATVGVFNSNLALDTTGSTPDLASPIASVSSPALSPPTLLDFVVWNLSEAAIPAGSTKVHGVGQLPPGDSGLLGIGADSTASHPGVGNSGFTTDGYATPSILGTFFDFGLNPGQDNSATTSCKQSDRKPHGRMRCANLTQGIGQGDHLTTTVKGGDNLNLAFYGSKSGDKLRLYFNVAPCTAAIAIGPVLPTIPDADGDGTFIRLNSTWPSGYGNSTFRFSAVWGNPGCSTPGVGFTNCVTVVTLTDPLFGRCDDGTVESGWVVQIPSGSSDYFNNNFGDGTGQTGIVGLTIAVLDFGTAIAAFPTSGVSNANGVVDPTGNTPDIGSPLATVSPFTFPALTFATTSGQYISHVVAIPGGSLSTNVHGWVQFPPGDSGLLGVGADTSSGSNGCSFFSLDGYSSPAVSFLISIGNICIRVVP